MTLDPAIYTCPEHHADLTALVEEALEDDELPVAYKRLPMSGRSVGNVREFEVIVTCPGTAASGPHELVCTGTWTR
jgi:hypothetical protein